MISFLKKLDKDNNIHQHSSKLLSELPSELIIKIFNLLGETQISACVSVSKSWKTAFINAYSESENSQWNECVTWLQKDLRTDYPHLVQAYEAYKNSAFPHNSVMSIKKYFKVKKLDLCKMRFSETFCLREEFIKNRPQNKYYTSVNTIISNFKNIKSLQKLTYEIKNDEENLAMKLLQSNMYDEVLFQISRALDPSYIVAIARQVLMHAPHLYDQVIDVVLTRQFHDYLWGKKFDPHDPDKRNLNPKDVALVYLIDDMWCNELKDERLNIVIKLCNLLSDAECKSYYLQRLSKQKSKCSIM